MVRIKDIADELGVSTATVSNVIHGKTKKISNETVKRVQALLEERQYIPNMAAVLLAQNSSKIICLVIEDCVKYESNLLQDPFIATVINYLTQEMDNSDYFMMIKRTKDINEIVRYASMWNMAGLILVGFCEQDYNELRRKIRIPFVVMDGFFEPECECANIGIDNRDGGYQVGKYLIDMGHEKVLYIADNDESMDHERYMGLQKAFYQAGYEIDKHVVFNEVSVIYERRLGDYQNMLRKIREEQDITAIFCASDVYAIEVMNYLMDQNVKIPEEISIVGFDDIPAATMVRPKLTTVRQDIKTWAKEALQFFTEDEKAKSILLPVQLVERETVLKRKSKLGL